MRETPDPGLGIKAALKLAAGAFAVAAVLNLLWLGHAPLADTTEARHAEVGREFAEGGHWLIPTLNYRPHLTKPPLTDWLVAGGILIFGENEFGARFGGALVAALGLALVAGFAARIGGRGAGIAAAALYFLTPVYLALSRTISIDIVLAVPVVAAVWAAWEAGRGAGIRERGSEAASAGASPIPEPGAPNPGSGVRWAAVVFWLAIGVGALAKGHIVLVLVLLPVAVWLALGKRCAAAARLCWPPAILLGLAVALPWFVHIAVRFPGWLTSVLASELGERTLGDKYGSAFPALSIVYLLAGAAPCVPLALLPIFGRQEEENRLRFSGITGLLICGLLLPLAVFSTVRCQRVNYVAPLVPAVAILAGVGCCAVLEEWSRAGRARRAAAYALPTVLGLTAAGWIASPFFLSRMDPCQFAVLASTGCVAALAAGLCALALGRSALHLALASFALLMLAVTGQTLAAVSEIKSMRSTREVCRSLCDRPEPWHGLVLYETNPMSAVFYLGGPLMSRGVESRDRVPGSENVRTGRHPPPWELEATGDLRGMFRRSDGLRLIIKSQDRLSIRSVWPWIRMKTRVAAGAGRNLLVHVRELPGPRWKRRGRRTPVRPMAPGEVDLLLANLRAPEPGKRLAAAKRLAELKGAAARAVPALVDALSDPNVRVRVVVARALGATGVKDEAITKRLIAGLESVFPATKSVCAVALGESAVSSPAAIRGLVGLMDDESFWVRRSAVCALAKIPVESEPERKLLAERLLAGLADKSPVLRTEALKALERLNLSWGAVGAHMLALLSDDDFRPRKAVVEVLGRVRPVREESIRALACALADEDWDVRTSAAEALGGIGPAAAPAVPELVKASKDRYWWVRLAALRALCSVAPGSEETLSALKSALKDKKARVRRAADGLLRAGGRISDSAEK
ncbi:MAG: HEAT repeat domain-containing protein [Planctomycetota bacterium]|jgi:4-amino-4-deoxy-L-arabinose transferase-like glycosyltransferase/HEAT repeat protein